MLLDTSTYIGVDPTAGRKPYTYAALDRDCQLMALEVGELDEILAFIVGQQASTVAVNAPPRPNLGLLRKRLEEQSTSPGHLRGADMRIAEHELRGRGITILPTLSRAELCPAWIQLGFELHARLAKMDFKPYPDENANKLVLETHPHAAFCVILGQSPLPKPTLEGRLQRQLILHEQGLKIKDPMEYFEEITRYRLIKGVLPANLIYADEELDALMAAYVAFLAVNSPENITMLGAADEGLIILPTAELKEQY